MTPRHDVIVSPANDIDDTAALYQKHLSTSLGRLGRLVGNHVEDTADGTRIRLADGRDYLNCGGYGTLFVGASHPHVVEQVSVQLRRRALSTKVLLDPVLARAAERLTGHAPRGITKAYFSPSGTDAVEVARKLCLANGYDRTVSFSNAFHGKTFGALGLTDNPKYSGSFDTQFRSSHKVPWGEISPVGDYLAQNRGRCAVFLEPIQSEAGVILPPPGFLEAVAAVAKRHDAVLVMDEIMTGLGRCGRWWQSADVAPDIVIAGKALSGGIMPVAATLCTDALHQLIDTDPFVHTSTFGGTPLQAAAVNAVLDVIEFDGLVQRSNDIGRALLRALVAISQESEVITEVRGAGLLIGIECVDGGFGGELFTALLQQGLIANHSLNRSAVVRLTPPATISYAEVDELFTKFSAAVAQVDRIAEQRNLR
jgi:putrescine aminotransferase